MTTGSVPGSIPARLGSRLLSLAYEALMLGAVLLAGGFAFTAVTERMDPVFARPAFQVFLLLLAGTYFVWQWCLGGQTLPMKTWRIRLVTVAGEPLTLRHAVSRFVLATAGMLFFGIGVVWALFDRDRQFLHDRLAGTKIVISDK